MPLTAAEAARQLGFAPPIARLSSAMGDVLSAVEALARDGRRVLLHGPSGAGKECLARFYAQEAIRSGHIDGGRHFVAVNCACLGSLAQSELFGHVGGAATDVRHARAGAFELAAGGLLFLDEVGDLPSEVQPLLLRALDPTSGTARRVGANDDFSTTGVTVIAATNRELDTLRVDFLARLGHVIDVPGLAERGAEIEPVLREFVRQALQERRDRPGSWLQEAEVLERVVQRITDRIGAFARDHAWPGNFRGLRTCVEFATSVAPLQSEHVDAERAFTAAVEQTFRRRAGGSPAELASPTSDAPRPAAPSPTERAIVRFLVEQLRGVDHQQHRALAQLLADPAAVFTRADVERATGLKNRTALKRIQLLKEHGLLRALDGGRYQSCEPVDTADELGTRSPLQPPSVEPDALGGEVDELCTLLERSRGVHVVGAAGSGKTRLATQVARVAGDHRAVLWVSLEQTSVSELLSMIEDELRRRGVEPGDNSQLDLSTRAVRLAGFMASTFSNALLIIDQLELAVQRPALEALHMIAQHWTGCGLLFCGRTAPPLAMSHGMIEHIPWSSAASRIHDHYTRYWRRRGRATGVPTSFESLSAELQRSNYESAHNIPAALARLSITIHRIQPWAVPRTPDITDAEIDLLAENEHQRWRRERERAGYTHGATRDAAAKTNPYLLDWHALPADVRAFTLDAVRQWPVILAGLGYEVRREHTPADLDDSDLIETLARSLHQRYVADRQRQGETHTTNSALVDYDLLPEELKEANRDSARSIPRKLALLGLVLTPDDAAENNKLVLSDQQIEELSAWEHSRWCWQKRLQGWIPGDRRDEHSMTSADLVPWEALSDAVKERDREKIAAIPDLLARAGSSAAHG